MRWWVVGLLLAGAALAGCTGSDEATSDDRRHVPVACGPGEASGNAPLIAPLRGDLEDVARRIAEALGSGLPPWDPERSDEHISAWRGEELHVEFHHDRGAWSIGRPDRWPTSSGQLEDFLEGLDVPWHVRVDRGREGAVHHFVQTWQGRPLKATYSEALPGDGSGRMGWWSGFTFPGLRDLSAARDTFTADQAVAAAPGMVRCLLDEEGKTAEAGYRITDTESWGIDVHQDSMVHRVAVLHTLPEPGHCGGSGRVAAIDAVTGGFLGWEWVPCD